MKLSEAAQRLQREGSTAESEAVGRLARSKGVETVGEALALSLSDMRQGAQLHSTADTVAFRACLAACVASPVHTGAGPAEDSRGAGDDRDGGWLAGVRAWAQESPLWGAFAFGRVVELAGESGAGKTQLALQLAIDVQRAVDGAEAAYVCAVVGGVASQEVVKELMRDHQPRDESSAAAAPAAELSTDAQRRRQQARHRRQNATGRPLCNVLCYDAIEGTGDVFFVSHSEAERVAAAAAAAAAASAADATEIL